MTGSLVEQSTEKNTEKKSWENFLKIVEKKIPFVEPWLPTLESSDSLEERNEGGVFTIKSSQSFAIQFLQTKHKQQIENLLEEYTGFKQIINFTLDTSIKKKQRKKQTKEELEREIVVQKMENLTQMQSFCNLNLKYKFENFVEGENSHFALSVAKIVANAPGQKFNPLFISGSVGVGKTHLMQAIGHEIMNNFKNLKIRYTSAEEFGNALIDALSSKGEINQKMKKFRDMYRNVDVLLIDDIQWIEGKDRTAEEIFNTFNPLYYAGKQIVFASDRPIDQIELIPDRLKSRLKSGIEANIKVPNLNTRFEIVMNYMKSLNCEISPDISMVIAQEFDNNVRELEGACNKLSAYKLIDNVEFDVENVREFLGLNEKKNRITIENILDTCAKYFNVEKSEILSTARAKDVAGARKYAIYLAKELLDLSYPKMAQEFKKTHSTIIYLYDNFKRDISLNKNIEKKVKELKDLLLR